MAEGRLIGGNLSVLCAAIGTPFAPSFNGKILFFEDIGEKPYRLDRMLTQLLNAGILQQVAGVAVGVNRKCDDHSANKTRRISPVRRRRGERTAVVIARAGGDRTAIRPCGFKCDDPRRREGKTGWRKRRPDHHRSGGDLKSWPAAGSEETPRVTVGRDKIKLKYAVGRRQAGQRRPVGQVCGSFQNVSCASLATTDEAESCAGLQGERSARWRELPRADCPRGRNLNWCCR